MLLVYPLASTVALFQEPFFNPVALIVITINISSLLLHHFPNSMFQLFGTVQLSLTMGTLARGHVDMVAKFAWEFKCGVDRLDNPVF